jgi:quercetin dioxygenase-like cupin family protein
VLEGTLEVSANRQSRVVGRGDSVRVRSDVPHRYANADSRLLTLVLVYTRDPGPGSMNH